MDISRRLRDAVSGLRFAAPVTHVYNPLEYAWEPHVRYLKRWGRPPKTVVLLGMNPGPYGMAQTGVPFGEISRVRDWLGIEGAVGRPEREHPARPVEGFACRRREVSGARLWGWAAARYGDPEAFFARTFVANYCPLVFMEAGGRNRTPDKLPVGERERLFAVCDAALSETVRCLGATVVVGVGAFAEARAQVALAHAGVRIGRLPHPSPASPQANRGWDALADAALAKLGLEVGRVDLRHR